MKKIILFGVLLFVLSINLSTKPAENLNLEWRSFVQADSLIKDKLEYFHFQTSGTPKRLLSTEAYQTIVQAAKLSGYEEGELEVIVYVVDKKSKEERRAPLPNFNTTPYRGSNQQKPKSYPKKFE
ncbi:MAG: hypothetical protein SFU91_09865 [Chloroherpetonaceae bacterium]|nr:hypothetical protein [Chloroherpetonaceae bacterium]